MGGRLARHMHAFGHEVLLGSRRAIPSPDWLLGARVVETRWDQPDALADACRDVDLLVHAAGMNAQDCSTDMVAALSFNGLATARLVAATRASTVKRIIYLSTAHVYSSPLQGWIDEDTCPRNLHPYATSHMAGENSVLGLSIGGPSDRVVLRLSNLFGAPVARDVNCWMLLVNDLCRQAVISKTMAVRSSGLQHRDFVPMNAFLDTFEKHFCQDLGNGLGGVFNLGTGTSLSVLEMATRVQQRCERVLGFKPALQTHAAAGAAQGKEPTLEYRSKYLTGSQQFPMDTEIDSLLKFCSANFAAIAG